MTNWMQWSSSVSSMAKNFALGVSGPTGETAFFFASEIRGMRGRSQALWREDRFGTLIDCDWLLRRAKAVATTGVTW